MPFDLLYGWWFIEVSVDSHDAFSSVGGFFEDLSDEEVIELLGRCLDYYCKNARSMERTGRFMRRSNIEDFWDYIGVRGKSRY